MTTHKVVPVDEELLREAAAVFGDYGNSTMRAKLLDAIHAAPAPSGEAVLWQWRRKGDPWTLDKTFNTEVFATTDDSEVRPLFAHPPAERDAEDGARLDFLLEHIAFPVASKTDTGGLAYQLFSQTEDEELVCMHDEARFYATPRGAIDAAIAARKGEGA